MTYEIVGFDPETYEEPVAVDVSTSYDRQTRSWVSFLVDADGNQVGDAMYDGARPDRDASVRMLRARLTA